MRGTVLVVDPLVVGRFRTAHLLESAGYKVAHAKCAESALECLLGPDLIECVLVEFQLGNHRADALFSAARHKCTVLPYFFVLVQQVEQVEIVRLSGAGFTGILSKPVNVQAMERDIAHARSERDPDQRLPLVAGYKRANPSIPTS